MKIADKITLSFFTAALIIICIATPILYIIERDNLKEAIFDHLNTTTQSRARHIETFLAANKAAIEQLSESAVIKRFLLTSKDDESYSRNLNDVMVRLEDTIDVAEYFYNLFVLNKDGIIVVSTESEDIGKDRSADFYFLDAQKVPFIKDAYVSQYTKRNSLAFSAPLVDHRTGEFLGVIVVTSNLDGLGKITIDRSGLGETGEIYLINKHGYMITRSRFLKDTPLKLKVDTENTRRALKCAEEFGTKPHQYESFVYVDYRGRKVLGAHNHIPEMQWALLAKIDVKEALAPLTKLRFLLLFLLIFVPVAAWIISAFVSRIILEPIHKLHKGTEIIGNGNLDHKTAITSKDEVGQLSMAFDKMTEDLKKTLVSRDYVDNIIGSMIDSLIVATPGGKIKTLNHATCELLGYKQEELIGKDISLLSPEEEMPFKGTKLEKLIKESCLENYEMRYKAKDGKKIPVLFSGSVMKDNNGNITSVVCVARDITERRKVKQALQNAYRELKDTQEQLIQSSKMAAMGQLAAGISHELNQPLTGIKGFAQTALMDLSKKNPIRSDLNKIVEQADCMDNIIRSIRTFAKRSDFQLKPVDVNEFIINSLSLLNEQFRVHDIQFKKSLDKGLPAVRGDANQLQQVFLNLLTNARDAIDSMEHSKKREVAIKSALSKDKKDIEITFKDTGSGISKKHLEHIFNPFFTTKSPDKGMGLGLSIVYRVIVENHKGKIDVKSEPGKGAAFKITLPVFRKERAT
jgi:PAS domain S-box-containing protein